jgi:hypothetical protein
VHGFSLLLGEIEVRSLLARYALNRGVMIVVVVVVVAVF